MIRIQNRDYTKEGELEVHTREYLIARGKCCSSGCRNCPYKTNSIGNKALNQKQVVSLVPSWTETLLAAGANLVGCTRYCIHPQDLVKSCIKVGGTKNFDVKKMQDLNPDFVIMDKEENTKEMAELCPFPILTSHVRSIEDLKNELESFSSQLNLDELLNYSKRIEEVIRISKTHNKVKQIPGVLDWWKKPDSEIQNYHLVYMIWKNPFMCVTHNTFIGSVLSTLGFGSQLWAPSNLGEYPEIKLSELPPNTIVLFSSEPFPFAKYKEEYLKIPNAPHAALVDGESFSWFGIRSIRFIENQLSL